MPDDEVIEAAELEGFELCWRPVGGKLCVGFVRGDDLRFPAFGDERLAFSYFADWLRRGRAFASPSHSGQSVHDLLSTHPIRVVSPRRVPSAQ